MYIYILFVVILTLSALLIHSYKVKKTKAQQLDGLSNIINIKSLISLVQKHRGLSAAKLNGDLKQKAELSDIERKVNQISNDLSNKKVATSCRWVSFQDHWSRLTKQNIDTDPQNNFKQHTQMISNLLYLLEDEAENSHLNSLSLTAMPNIGYVWRELVASTETIGQSRAIGVGVATVGNCSSVDKIRLSFLEQHIKQTSKDILSKLSFLDSFSGQHKTLLTTAQTKMTELTNIIEFELIQTSSITITANDYFTLATDSISAIDDIFNNQLEQIKITL
jgi:uncharacterized membrane protein YheB (UPF0754 family)